MKFGQNNKWGDTTTARPPIIFICGEGLGEMNNILFFVWRSSVWPILLLSNIRKKKDGIVPHLVIAEWRSKRNQGE